MGRRGSRMSSRGFSGLSGSRRCYWEELGRRLEDYLRREN